MFNYSVELVLQASILCHNGILSVTFYPELLSESDFTICDISRKINHLVIHIFQNMKYRNFVFLKIRNTNFVFFAYF